MRDSSGWSVRWRQHCAWQKDSNVIGIDIDSVWSTENEAFTNEAAADVVDRFQKAGAYIERSPSGTGFRILTRGGHFERFGKGVGDFKWIEVYGPGLGGQHFLSVTGNKLPGSGDKLEVCQAELAWLYPESVPIIS